MAHAVAMIAAVPVKINNSATNWKWKAVIADGKRMDRAVAMEVIKNAFSVTKTVAREGGLSAGSRCDANGLKMESRSSSTITDTLAATGGGCKIAI